MQNLLRWHVLVLCILFAVSVTPRALERRSGHNRFTRRDHEKQVDCGFTGTNDIYGLGIRTGYYSQAISLWIARYFVLEEARFLTSVNLLFLLSAFIGLIRLTTLSPNVYAIEAFLLFQIVISTWYTGSLKSGRFSKRYIQESPARVIITSWIFSLVLGYNAWLFWTGLDQMKKSPCGTFIFFFAKVDLFGWYRKMYTVLSIPVILFGLLNEMMQLASAYMRIKNDAQDGSQLYPALQDSLALQVMELERPRGLDATKLGGDLSTSALKDCHAEKSRPTDTPVCEHLGIANWTPLSPSPSVNCSTMTSPKSVLSTTRSIPTSLDVPSFDDLLTAEESLQSVLDVKVEARSRKYWALRIPGLKSPLGVFIPTIHSPATLLSRWQILQAHRPLRTAILLPIFQHLRALHRYPSYTIMLMFEQAVLSPSYVTISPATLRVVLEFHTVNRPRDIHQWTVIWQAISSLSLIAGLITSIELAIRWNSIGGLGDIGQVGQLIPAIIGVGSLFKVIWAWGRQKKVDTEEQEQGVKEEARQCKQVFERLKRLHVDRRIENSAPQE